MGTLNAKTAPNQQMFWLRKRAAQLLVVILLMAAFLFIPAGRLDWIEAWVLLGIYLAVILVNAVGFLRRDTGIIAERAQVQPNVKKWDLWVTRGLAVFGFFLPLIIAGLGIRFNWGPQLPTWLKITGGLLYVAGYGLASWAMHENRFFSTHVRIQSDRGHQVCDSGPYRLIRHPGYLGMLLYLVGTPLLLGSLWALAPTTAGIALLILRTALEDRTLRAELPGYVEFTQLTRYRLIPGVW